MCIPTPSGPFWIHYVHPIWRTKVESGLRIRVDNELREAFIKACNSRDMKASQVLRNFMREFVERAAVESVQGALFDHAHSRAA